MKTDEKEEDRKHSESSKSSDASRKSEDSKHRDSSEKDEHKKSVVSDDGDRKQSKAPEKDEDRKQSIIPEKDPSRKSTENPKKSHVSMEDVRRTQEWMSHEPTGEEEAFSAKKEKKKSRADTLTWKSGSVSCGDAKRLKIEIEQLSNEVHETFAASIFAVKKSYTKQEAMKALRKSALELSELLNEIAKAFISKLSKIQKEKVRASLTSATELFLKQAETIRSEFQDSDEYGEEVQLCIDTCMTEIRRVEKSLRSSSEDVAILLKRSLIIAMEQMLEIASTPFQKNKL